MSIEIIDILKPKNGLSFKLVEDVDIAVQGYESLADAVSHFVTLTGVQQIINAALSGKQDKLTSSQLTAVNSGITSELTAQISLNTSAISTKASQADLTALTSTVNSKANAADLAALETEVDGKADASDLTTATASLQAQIDNIVSGSTADSEVINARVGADSTSYNTLKARLDAEFNKNASKIDAIANVTVTTVTSTNLLNKSDPNYKANTIIDTSGNETSNENNTTTGFIACNNNDSFVLGYVSSLTEEQLTRQNATFVYLYDENKTFLSRSSQYPFVDNVYTVNSASAKYIRFSISNTLAAKDYVMIAKSSVNVPYEPYFAPYYVNVNDADIDRIDTELTNAHVGTDGTSYSTLKARLDAENNAQASQISANTSQISAIAAVTVTVVKSTNLLNKNDSNYKVNTIIDASGDETENENNSTTGYIECNNNDDFIIGYVTSLSETQLTRQNALYAYLYDENKEFISRSSQYPFSDYVYTVSSSTAKYVRFSFSNTLAAKEYLMIAKSSTNVPYEAYYPPYYANAKDADINRLDAKIDSALAKRINTHIIDLWGDSRMEMGYATGKAVADYLQTELGDGYIASNYGVSSQSSGMVCARLGSNEVFVSTTNNKIAASGTTALTGIKCSVGNNRNLYAYSETAYIDCSINGVRGKLSRSSIADYSKVNFVRLSAGEEVTVKPNTKIIIDNFESQNHATVLWFGKNDFATAAGYVVSGILANYNAAVNYLGHDKFVILGETCSLTESYETGQSDRTKLEEINLFLSTAYPNNYIDINSYLASEQALTDVGLTATADDLANIAKGFPCEQLMVHSTVPSDTVHPNEKGREAIAKKIHAFMVAKGWTA